MASLTVYATTNDDECYYNPAGATGESWATAHAAATGSAVRGGASLYSWSKSAGEPVRNQIGRTFFPFDTSILPDNCTIDSAVFSAYSLGVLYEDNDSEAFATVIQTSQSNPNGAIVVADYSEVGSTEGIDSGQRKALDGISTSAYLDFTLNATGIGFIDKVNPLTTSDPTKGTRLGIREGHDALNISIRQSPIAFNYYNCSSSDEAGTSQDPKLVIEYTLAAETTFYPDPGNFVDGTVYGSERTGTWATEHDNANGTGVLDNNDTPAIWGISTGKSGTGKWNFNRYIALFDTSALGAGASISAATMSMCANGGYKDDSDNDGDDFITIVNVVPGNLNGITALNVADYNQVGDAVSDPTEMNDTGDRIDIGDWVATDGTYNSFPFNATGIGLVSKTGTSGFGSREGHDVLDEPLTTGNSSANRVYIYTSNAAGTSTDPKLVVTTGGGATAVGQPSRPYYY